MQNVTDGQQRQGMRTQKEHVIAMFCSLLMLASYFSNLFLGVVERRIGIPKHPFALCTGFEMI